MVTYNVSLANKVVLVTGAAGFIGANLVKRLLNEFDSVKVIGIDNITEYYDCLLYTSPSPRDSTSSRMPSSA